MEFRVENKEDYYLTIKDMYESHKFPVLSVDNLPEDIYVVSKEERDIYAIPVYKTNSSLCWLAFPVSDGNLDVKFKEDALDKLLVYITESLKEEGYNIIFTTSGIPYLENKFIKAGYSFGDTNINQYFKQL